MNSKLLTILLLFFYWGNMYAQQGSSPSFESGKALFNTYCLSCHGVHQERMGPMLASVTQKRSEEWLKSFIRNSQGVILSGDPYANFLFEQYNQSVMPSFQHLSERQIQQILLYIKEESATPSEETISLTEENLTYPSPNVVKGKELFGQQCATCHFIDQEGYGPSLGSVTNRRPRPWLINFIKNSQQVIKQGDHYAQYLFNSYEQKVMPPFEFLDQEDIIAILDFIAFASAAPSTVAGVNGRKSPQEISARVLPTLSAVSPTTSKVEEKDVGERTIKIGWIVFSLMGGLVHGAIILKLYFYLSKDGSS